MEQFNKGITRRTFLTGSAAAVGSFAAGSVIGFQTVALAAPVKAGFFRFPFGTGTLPAADINEIKQKAFEGYFEGGCCYGAAYGLIDWLKGKYPAGEWDSIPLDMFRFGAGGALSWGTTCGALNGAMFVVNAVYNGLVDAKKPQTDPANAATDRYTSKYGAVTDNLFAFYQNAAFPLDDAALTTVIQAYGDGSVHTYTDGTTGAYDFSGAKATPVTSICYSPLCHASVSTWCEAANEKVGGVAKKVRCARLTADVAAKAAEFIATASLETGYPYKNQGGGDLTYIYGWKAAGPAQSVDCIDCHNAAGATSKRDDEQGKLNCNVCHDSSTDNLGVNRDDYTGINKAPKCAR